MRGKAVLQALIALLLGACLVVVVAADAGAADAHDGAGETGTIGDKFGSGLGPASNPISEAGIRAIELSLMESALNGDLMGGFRKMLQSFSVLHDLWADTEIFGAMLEGLPMLRALKGVDAIAAKDRITVEDGRRGAQLFRDFLFKAMDVMETVRDPDKYAAKILEYADPRDAPVAALLQRIEQGDRGANAELQKLIVDRELGDLIDLDFLGINGVEPDFIKTGKAKAMADEYGFWDKIVEDPVARRYMEDPLLAYREWEDYSPSK